MTETLVKPVANSRVLLLLILLLAFGLRVYKSGSYGLYLDEKYTMIIAQGIAMGGANQQDVFYKPGKSYFTPQEFWKPKTLADFIEANIRGDIGNSPVYYGILWVWMQVFGMSDFAVRLPSVIISTLTVALVFIFVKKHLKSESLAALCAFLAAIEPFFVAYSHMARNYSLSFFLTLLSTHVFLLIVGRFQNRISLSGRATPVGWLYAGYGLLFTLAVLSHYLTVTVFLCHGLYLLFFVRNAPTWRNLAITYVLALVPIVLWFVYGGGKYTFKTLAHQAQLYKQVALTNPTTNKFGLILPATLSNVVNRSLPIGSDLFTVTNGLGSPALGDRNRLMAFILGVVAAFLVHRYRRQQSVAVWVSMALAGLLLAGALVATIFSLQLVVMALAPLLVYLLYVNLNENRLAASRQLLIFLAMLTLIPTLFLILMAFRSGHTYGITQRYSGFSFPYAIIFVAFAIREVWFLPQSFRLIIGAVLLVQLGYIIQLLVRIYQDRDPKYTYFTRPRIANPYSTSAQRIRELYTEGDTVLYPSIRLRPVDEIEKTLSPYSIEDAQLTNLYLPRNAQYLQRMDTTQTDRIILVKGRSGQQLTIFDFKGTTYRY
ncbi:MAG: glycosyltransferase family 39 protein [Cytophagaceae bacterium]|nr:glycosyltransferase family 39 protein [Cytophagaceae bacterium]